MTTPVVSILIPNFNNGPSSANDGRRDFLGDLLQSLHDTLADDPMPVEIIIADDGSTDESLATARQWSNKTWTQGGRAAHPFCTLMEFEHCGVLSIVANRLTHEAAGDILVRLDGDIVIHTPDWASELKRIYDNAPPDVGVVGPLQLAPDGFVHAAGDWLLHPRGYHHIGQGAPGNAITRSLEVDHVMGCFYSFTRAVWDAVGEYDESILRGQTVDYSMRARRAGFRVWFVPTIVFTHYHSQRKPRANEADRDEALVRSQQRFREKWGFDRRAADLDEVAKRYRGTPLLWNAKVFGPAVDGAARGGQPIPPQRSRWKAYAENAQLQELINAQVDLAAQSIETEGKAAEPIVQVSCGDGLLCHLLAQRGLRMIGIDSNPAAIALAQQMTGAATYDDKPPPFHVHRDGAPLPVESNSVGCALLLNVLEVHANPVGLLKRVHAVLKPGGVVLIVTTPRPTPLDSDVDRGHLYREHELDAQLHNIGLFEVTRPSGGPHPRLGILRLLRVVEPTATREARTRAHHDRTPVAAG